MSNLSPAPLAYPEETLFEYICRHVELLKGRESQLGKYPGDGPTVTQACELIDHLRPLSEATEPLAISVLWNAFQSTVKVEMTWLFPEKDPLGESLTWALEKVQESTGKLLVEYGPVKHEQLEQYVSVALVARAANRQVKLKGNGINWRLVLARTLHWFGGEKRKR
jgi:hypothetical protein